MFKFHMTFQGEGGLLITQTVRVPSYGWRGLAKSSFRLQKCYMMRHMGVGGKGWLKTSEYRHVEGRGLKLLKEKTAI